MINASLSNNYFISEQLGSGAFGEVYLAENEKGNYVAAKVEEKKHSPRLYNEYKIYHFLGKSNFKSGLPKIYEFVQTTENYSIMYMQLLGPNLEELFNKHKRAFKLSTVFNIAYQLIDLLEKMHKAGFIHRDIKPNNFLVGKDNDSSQLYITDFGLSKKYISSGKHMKYRDHRSLIGTARYASINMHMGIEPSRRDDMESVGYMLIYFIKGSLPWQSIKKQKNINHIEKIGEIKMCTNLGDLCCGIHNCFREYLSYCKNLKFDEEPNYAFLKKLFKSAAEELKLTLEFEWQMVTPINNFL
jgi:serine/threonine protein kinase